MRYDSTHHTSRDVAPRTIAVFAELESTHIRPVQAQNRRREGERGEGYARAVDRVGGSRFF